MPTPTGSIRVGFPQPNLAAFGGNQVQTSQRAWASAWGGIDSRGFVGKFFRLLLTTNAVTVTSWEAGLYTAPLPANGAGQTLTRVTAVGGASMDSIVAGAPKFVGNTNPLSIAVAPGAVYFLVVRTEAVTPPGFAEGTPHTNWGEFMMLDACPDLTAAGGASLVFPLPTMAQVNHTPPWIDLTED